MALRLTSDQVRQGFIDFFVSRHGHTFVPSSPVVPHDDPTLLFTNAGMNQFKPVFLGLERRPYSRAVNTQKCIRAGGKHNDLDDVGRSRRHHTFFEMLGNWSFGDYFKQGAIEMSWELLTEVWGLDPRRLHVTCFEGDENAGVPRDTEAADIWRQVGNWERYGLRSDDHIHFFGTKDNFWEMGETGPCGPCTEISIDRRPQAEIDAERAAGRRAPVNGDDPRVMEVWNNVFIQFNRNPDRSLTPLPAKHVDTGMGLERIIQVLQGVDSNYEIDLFHPYWDALARLSGHRYGARYPKTNAADPVAEAADPDLRRDIAFRVIADHIRCLTFALTDGATPGNEGRGYVLRRILRRAVRFGRQQLELREPFLHTLVAVVVDSMGHAFPELKNHPERVADILRDEEVSFGRTLDRGIQLFEEAVAGRTQMPAEAAFKLHDTYGFPIDLTRIMAEERGLTVDLEGYEQLMEQARELARTGGKAEASPVGQLPPAALDELARRNIPATDDQPKYAHDPVHATVLALWNGSQLLEQITGGEVAVILDRTPFYAEMGGQVGDTGTIGPLRVITTRAVGPYILHVGNLAPAATIRVGERLDAAVGPNRTPTEQNHTATHLANWALRETLGEAVQQKGSLVDPEKLRFDFSHGKALEPREVEAVEQRVREQIAADYRVYADLAPQEQALRINGLRAVFGEKYPPQVRVVSIGVPVAELLQRPDDPRWRQFSIEFCGGTHLQSTAAVEDFVITEESAVAKGIRRIVALTGASARTARHAAGQLLSALDTGDLAAVQTALTAPQLPLLARRHGQARLAELQAQVKAAEKAQKASLKLDTATLAHSLLEQSSPLATGRLVVAAIEHADDNALRAVIDSIRKRQPSHAVLLASVSGERITLVAAVSDDLIARGLKAGDWVREAARAAGGGGGGKPQLAQAGGKDPTKLPDALEAARGWVRKTVSP